MKAHFYFTSYNNLRIKTDIEFDVPYGYNQYIREIDDETYPYVISNYNAFLELVDENNIDETKIKIHGVNTFYGYKDNFGDLNGKFLEDWNKYQSLTRYKLNKDHGENMFGIHMIAWEKILIQFEDKFYLEGLTPEELNIIIDNTEGIIKEKALTLLEVLESEDEIKRAREIVNFYEKRIQYIIDDHKEEILKEFDGELYDYKNGNIKPYKINTGLDCGFLNVYSKNEIYNEAKEKVVLFDKKADWMNVRLPYSPQSITLKEKIFKKVKEVVDDFIGEKLYCKTVLD